MGSSLLYENDPVLAKHFFEQIAAREGRASRVLGEETLEALRTYHWPGNVRELQNICERAAVLSPDVHIEASLIAPWLNWGGQSCDEAAVMSNGVASIAHESNGTVDKGFPDWMICNGRLLLSDIEREAILATLARHDGHRQKSARALGIGVRTLGLKLKKWKDERLVEATI